VFLTSETGNLSTLLLHPSPHPAFFSHRLLPQLILPAMSPRILLTPHHAGDQDTLPVLLMVGRGFLCIVVGLQKRMNASRTFFKKRGIKRHVSSPLRLSGTENTSEGGRETANGRRVRSGMDTVVGFLAGLVSGQADSERVHANQTLKTNKPCGLLSRLISQGLHQPTVSVAMVCLEDVEASFCSSLQAQSLLLRYFKPGGPWPITQI
jgi:hypothetical protein